MDPSHHHHFIFVIHRIDQSVCTRFCIASYERQRCLLHDWEEVTVACQLRLWYCHVCTLHGLVETRRPDRRVHTCVAQCV